MNIDEVWNCVVAMGGANEGSREEFRSCVQNHKEGFPFEFRFMGHFGFGGKLRMKEGYFQADYYPEDKTDERERKLRALNYNLARLRH
jgi:hypothetical protein